MLLAGLELLAIPLSGVLARGQLRLVIYIGIGGVSGALIGGLLITAGIVAWAAPAHRAFYGIAGVLLGTASFPASNLGGFFLGMTLAIAGGALAFAWTPADPRAPVPAQGSGLPSAPESRPPASSSRSRFLAAAALPAIAAAGLAGPGSATSAPAPCALGIFCSAPTAPSASGSPGAASPAPTPRAAHASPGLLPASPAPAGSRRLKQQGAASPWLTAPGAVSVLSARSATMVRLRFAGIAVLPLHGGGSERALKFTAASASLSAVSIAVAQDGASVTTATSSLGFPGGMTLYTTKLCGRIEGIVPEVCFTPSTASRIVLELASVLGRVVPVTITGVTADRFISVAPAARWGQLAMSARTS